VRVGNIMIDSYEMLRDKIEAEQAARTFGLASGAYGVVTLHRPANVDREDKLAALVSLLADVGQKLPLIFPVHPRTQERLRAFALWEVLENAGNIHLLEPLGYISFMSLVQDARLVITDSGGIQEETTYLDIPCLTLRDTTERPITISQGTNRLVNLETLSGCVQEILLGRWQRGTRPQYWDGRTAERVVRSLRDNVGE
jgi:UDP-N-acetylglucosamine 2-epimerase (non-hydrolysing)